MSSAAAKSPQVAPFQGGANAAPAGAANGTAAPAAGAAAGGPAGFASASLYVGDLAADVTEALLFELFNAIGPVASVRVCRDAATRRSLGYAYVNFHRMQDAEQALESMNFAAIRGRPCRIMWSHRDPTLRRSGAGNVFIRNLHPTIENKDLHETMSIFGAIMSCKVARSATGESLGYGFVHYESAADAATAIERVNGMAIAGQEVEVQPFRSKRERSGGKNSKTFTNIYVKHLPVTFTGPQLEKLFEKFGKITSFMCPMEQGPPKPRVKHSAASAAAATADEKKKKDGEEAKAADKENGGEEQDGAKKDDADSASKKKEEGGDASSAEGEKAKEAEGETADDSAAASSTGGDKDDDKAAAAAKKEGGDEEEEAKKKEGPDYSDMKEHCRGYGFVNFADPECAARAVEELNGTMIEGADKPLFVGRAQKKAEREKELRDRFESIKLERQKKWAGVNLYVKNLHDDVDDEKLREVFSPCGEITSACVMRDKQTGKSRGFGFVCYSSPEESTKAVTEKNGQMLMGKPLYVALAQRKEVRRAQLEAQHAQRAKMGVPAPAMGYAQGAPMFYAAPHQQMVPGGAGGPRMGMYPGPPGHPGMMGGQQQRWNPAAAAAAAAAAQARPQMMPVSAYMGMQGMRQGGQPGQPRPGGQQRGQKKGGQGPAGGFKYTAQVRNQGAAQMQQAAAAQQAQAQQVPAGGAPSAGNAGQQRPLTIRELADAPEDQQKRMIGERLFPMIHQQEPALAGKITGMLLEMDNTELLHLLESRDALDTKVNEALAVLHQHEAAKNAAGGEEGSTA